MKNTLFPLPDSLYLLGPLLDLLLHARYFAIMLALWKSWRERHRHPVSFALHAVAIPMLVLAVILIVVQLIDGAWELWWRPVLLIVVSYLLQWIGHVVEGNDMGEVILIKKLLGRPYVAIASKEGK